MTCPLADTAAALERAWREDEARASLPWEISTAYLVTLGASPRGPGGPSVVRLAPGIVATFQRARPDAPSRWIIDQG